jgi:hypothetical protein
MFSLFTKLMGSKAGLKGLVAAGVLGIAPTAAFAGHRDDVHVDFRFGPHGPSIDFRHVEPERYENREVRVWVEPVYRTVCDRVWVPDRFEDREVVRYWRGRRRVSVERVLCEPGHYQEVQRQECVTPGHYETHLERVCVQ